MTEEWREIPGWPGYEASSLGQIRSKHGILKQSRDYKGYLRIKLWRHSKAKNMRVSGLVALAFHGPVSAGHVVRHRNGVNDDNRANPYPRNGRTVEVAKSIVTDIQSWGHSLPNSPAKRDLIDATDTLYSLLVSGWTEVDEALGQISTAMHYLNRWQGLGGRLGNAS